MNSYSHSRISELNGAGSVTLVTGVTANKRSPVLSWFLLYFVLDFLVGLGKLVICITANNGSPRSIISSFDQISTLEKTNFYQHSILSSLMSVYTQRVRIVSKNTMTTSACLADVWVRAPVIVAREHSKRSASSDVVLADTAALSWGTGYRPELCLRHHHPRSVFGRGD